MKDLHKIFALYIGCDVFYKLHTFEMKFKICGIQQNMILDERGNGYPIKYCKLILKPNKDITAQLGLTPMMDIDELRELGYDCGYKDIPKLLETPIATTMEEAKKLIKKI